MVYIMGIIGFIGGFVIGQMLLSFLLRHKTKEELLHDKSLQWKYGIINWFLAAAGAWFMADSYTKFFTS